MKNISRLYLGENAVGYPFSFKNMIHSATFVPKTNEKREQNGCVLPFPSKKFFSKLYQFCFGNAHDQIHTVGIAFAVHGKLFTVLTEGNFFSVIRPVNTLDLILYA